MKHHNVNFDFRQILICLAILLAEIGSSFGRIPDVPIIPINSAASLDSSLWYLLRGGPSDDQAWGVDVDSLGNIYFSTLEKSPPLHWFFDAHLYKLTPTGQQLWESTTWGGDFNEFIYIAKAKPPHVYLGGRIDTCASLTGTCANLLVLAFDWESGHPQWHYTWDQGIGYEEVDGLAVIDEGIYLSGWTQNQSTQMDIVIQKLSLDGRLLWSTIWGTPGWDAANGHMVLDENTIYVAGHYDGQGYGFGGDALLIAFSRDDGHYLWHTTWGGAATDDAYGMAVSSDSFLYLVGPTVIGSGTQIFLNKYTRTGQLQWSTTWGGAAGEVARTIIADGDSIVYVTANWRSYGAGGDDIALLKYGSDGELVAFQTWGAAGDDVAQDLVAFGDHLYIVGKTNGFGAQKADALLLKVNGRTMQFPELPVAVDESARQVPLYFTLQQNYSNLFNATTSIEFIINQAGHLQLLIYDVQGCEIQKVIDSMYQPGSYKIHFNSRDLTPGVYFYQLRTDDFFDTKKWC